MHMLDRVAAGLASLAPESYSTVVLLAAPDVGTTPPLLGRAVVAAVAAALAPDGRLVPAAGSGGLAKADRTEGILAGLLVGEDGALVKPLPHEAVALLPRRGAAAPAVAAAPSGVGFVHFGNGHEIVTGEDEDEEDDELVDEDDLLTEEDRMFVQREPFPPPPYI
jgi:hypothetical protein